MNRGNFLEILHFVKNHDTQIAKKKADMPKITKYTSPEIQNKVLEILADIIRKEIIEEGKGSGEFSSIVDETKEVSKTEQISFVLRYYHDSCVKESFLQFEAADKLDVESLTNTIFSCLDKFGLDYKSHLVGQGYDGESVASGRISGVAKRIKEICPTAEYIRCYAHRLNLVLVDSTKSVSEAANFFSLLERL
ncbi:zinc finger MYM-type protein 1-like [Palaemon carinicauda]|uniref:zinc finger MYM-type protein 1-like n=1 Tax=Palaemon carinicauda TaxID=392227 RepID=UPI0035B5A8CE